MLSIPFLFPLALIFYHPILTLLFPWSLILWDGLRTAVFASGIWTGADIKPSLGLSQGKDYGAVSPVLDDLMGFM